MREPIIRRENKSKCTHTSAPLRHIYRPPLSLFLYLTIVYVPWCISILMYITKKKQHLKHLRQGHESWATAMLVFQLSLSFLLITWRSSKCSDNKQDCGALGPGLPTSALRCWPVTNLMYLFFFQPVFLGHVRPLSANRWLHLLCKCINSGMFNIFKSIVNNIKMYTCMWCQAWLVVSNVSSGRRCPFINFQVNCIKH